MYKHSGNPPQGSLFGQERTKSTKVSEFLKVVPYLTFSEKGIENIAKRFNLTVEELRQLIVKHEAGEGR